MSPSIMVSVQPLQITAYSENISSSSPSNEDADSWLPQQTSPRPAMLHQSPQSTQTQMPPSTGTTTAPSAAAQPYMPKTYPPGRRIVYDQLNPNTPPIYPCGLCHKAVEHNDRAILCEMGCKFWFHRVCSGLTDDAFDLLTHEVDTEWVCSRCASSMNRPLALFKL
ncbi:protein pygopus-like [Rhipicephalus sanguineus]|uniref:protein pygopus-like n=1 Tax=Rhipicephalus sanguineus TaxID=34632 RepID=UPI0020C2A73E|nr:protein pygopus-like [Rhipicephalus sanguineus]